MKICGVIVSESDYDRLLWAKENSIKVIGGFKHSFWVDDIWDKSMYMKEDNNYWDGWINMCQSNATYIECDDYSLSLSGINNNI